MRKSIERRIPIGSLRDDVATSARRVQGACAYATMTVWADDLSNIRVDPPDRLSHVPEYAIIGTYSMGVPLGDIEDDLRAERRERARSSIAILDAPASTVRRLRCDGDSTERFS